MRKNNKRALVVSTLCLLLCVTMLVGSTFAWFTDNASTTVNTIEAGTLKIDIVDNEGNSLNGKPLSFEDKDDNKLWEPGCTYRLAEANLVNKGNLALKYKVEIKSVVGNTELADVIEVTFGSQRVGTLADMMADPDGAAYGTLLPGKSTSVGQIELHMLESAGNKYQGMKLEGLALHVSATQYTHEYDSDGNQYDKDAEFAPVQADVFVSSSEDLVAQLKAAEQGDVIAAKTGSYVISESVATKGSLIVEAGEGVTIDLGGNTLSAVVSKSQNAPTVLNYGTLTISNGSITNKNATAGNTNVAAVHNVSGTLTLQNCTITNTAPTSGGSYAVVVEGGVVAMNDCAVSGGRGGIAVSGSGVVNMNGGSVSASVYYPLYTRGTGASTFDGVTFTKLNNSKGKAITYNAFGTDGGTVAFANCTFKSETAAEVPLDISSITTGFTFVNCTFDNVKNPNA